ncbi:hypothetical protein QH494_19190 [Sphingomonas sp. AR_OL41]|jgi:hypothetical protein|uniref:hypothetical protein n=1 Tax=Sphingomonas sp. AR_OL41 TaxID=3042729 RepID=UPI002480BCDA|nr:hypothetical protein [Sphingomonas sp. AR_OL41]MDH7974319.1 hypothetical protein [Sphingomonas sp. AR_OL41]
MNLQDIRDAYRVRDGYWFAPKRFGYGAMPVTWQAWAMTLGLAGAILLAVRLLPSVPEKIIGVLALIGAMIAVSIAKTDGEWRWRSGERDR